jgi:predicted anti-sigma-YlaC factor YlaD
VSGHDAIERMLSAHLDGELTQADDQRVRLHLEDCSECRAAFAQMEALHREAARLRFVAPREEQMEEMARRASVRAPKAFGWVLIVIGVAVWIGYAAVQFWTDPEVLTWERLTVAAVLIGSLLLLVSVARQRWLELPGDRYRGVKR